jgi:thymidine kinase
MNVQQKKGRLEVICGSMFSGKTEELLRRLARAEYARQNVLTIKHHVDNRYDVACITSHNGRERCASIVDATPTGLLTILDQADANTHVVGFDEIQFFPTITVSIIKTLVECGKRVIVAGLDLDFRGEPFGIMPSLLALADEVVKLKAVCVKCGKDAHHTQRLVEGMPARYDDATVLVGAAELYEARCRDCFEIELPFTQQLMTPLITPQNSTS